MRRLLRAYFLMSRMLLNGVVTGHGELTEASWRLPTHLVYGVFFTYLVENSVKRALARCRSREEI